MRRLTGRRKVVLLGFGLVQGHGGTNERLQRLLVDLLALVEVDGTPGVPLEAGVEEARRVLQRRPLGEGHLHDALVGLAGADHPVVVPRRDAAPLPLLDDFGIGLLDQGAEPAEHLAPPVAELLDPRVDQLRRRLALLRPAGRHGRFPLPLSRYVARRSCPSVTLSSAFGAGLAGFEPKTAESQTEPRVYLANFARSSDPRERQAGAKSSGISRCSRRPRDTPASPGLTQTQRVTICVTHLRHVPRSGGD